jgi:hypothetical protein
MPCRRRTHHHGERDREIERLTNELRNADLRRLELAATVTELRAFASQAEQFAAKLQRRVS